MKVYYHGKLAAQKNSYGVLVVHDWRMSNDLLGIPFFVLMKGRDLQCKKIAILKTEVGVTSLYVVSLKLLRHKGLNLLLGKWGQAYVCLKKQLWNQKVISDFVE